MRTVLFGLLVSFNLVACVAGDNLADDVDDVAAGDLDSNDPPIHMPPDGELPALASDRAIANPGDVDPALEPTTPRTHIDPRRLPPLQPVEPPQLEQDTPFDADPGAYEAELEPEGPRKQIDRDRPLR